MNRKTAAIIGAGYMAKEYYKVLRAMGHSVLVLGRGEEKARAFEEEFGQKVFTGDFDSGLLSLSLLLRRLSGRNCGNIYLPVLNLSEDLRR